MEAPSMVQRSGDQLIVRSVVSGDQLYCDPGTILANIAGNINKLTNRENSIDLTENFDNPEVPTNKDEGLPQCKIKRNYSCNNCTYFTQNPRHYLTHLRDIHGERIVINECKLCLYASRHYQKLVRHMKMVHGSTEGIDEPAQSRKRASQLTKKTKRRKIDNNNDMIQQIQNYIPLELKMDRVLDTPEKMISACVQMQEHNDEFLQKGDGAKSFKCTKCTYETHIKARYSKHVKYHTMPMIKCIMCDFRTPYKWNLDRHMKNHGGTGQFRCSACNFTAEIKQSLTVHETNHHVPPVGHASGMNLSKRRNKVGGTDIPDEFIADGILLQQEKYANMKEMSWPESMLSNSSFNNNNNSFNENRNSILNYSLIKSEGESSSPELNSQLSPPRKASRPVPNLIPILQNSVVNPVIQQQTALNLSMTPNRSSDSSTSTMTHRDLRELCSKSTNSSLKDFASLFGSEEFLAGDYDRMTMPQLSPSSNVLFKKKNASFFDKLKEKLISGTGDGSNLVCQCGHTAKCLSESVIHQKSCSEMNQTSSSPVPNLGSTRCQHCRHRCKSSADLISHLSVCAEAQMNADSYESSSENGSGDRLEIADESMDESPVDNPNENNEPHPMENVVFVWNKRPEGDENQDKDIKKECTTDDETNNTSNESHQAENSFYGIETAPGYGEVTKEISPGEETPTAALKKVFKCPHCSFWASTASRFHVHIVGHLNKKPFECSLCSYRSNWRWDITKHIRLKTIRDPNHESARVLMNDETGRRNYTKYNKYMTLMKVTDDNNKSMKSGDITHNQDLIVCNTSSSNKSGKSCENGIPQTEGNSISPREVPLTLLNTNIYDLTKFSGGESSGVSVTKSDNDKKTSFKCKKCNYMHPDRNVVLLHVKEHYREAGIPINKQKVTSPIPVVNTLSPQPISEQFIKTNNLLMNGLLEIMYPSIVGSVKQQQQQINSTNTSSSSMLNNTNNEQSMMMMATEHGEMEEASSGGTSVSEWRPAPYRCGHCHQVSNWKHVIQRHCRLKHNGDIKIELMDKDSSNKTSTVTIPIPSTITTSTPTATTATTIIQPIIYQPIVTTNPQTILNEIPTSVNEKSNEEEVHTIPLTVPKQLIPSTSTANQQIKKLKKYQCDLCPYITDNKYQHTYHKSFHSPREEAFQCTFCTYNVSKRHLLNQHMRMHANEVVTVKQEIIEVAATIPYVENNAVDLRVPYGKGTTVNEKKLIYCSKCPGRFLAEKDVKLHMKMHTATFPYKCTVCSYTARQQSYLESHISVHTLDYQEKTKELEGKYKISSQYAKPIIKSFSQDGIEVWIVSSTTQEKVQDHFDLDEVIVSSIVPNSSFNQIELNDDEEDEPIIDNQLIEISKNTDEISHVSEKCPYCPFATTTHSNESLKIHLQNHKCVSGKENLIKCDHCDYSVFDENILQDHIKLHFNSIKNRKNVAFVTSYKNLELHKVDLINSNNNNNNIVNKNGKMSGSSRLVFKDPKEDGVIPIDDIFNSHSISDERKYFIDISTGNIIGNN